MKKYLKPASFEPDPHLLRGRFIFFGENNIKLLFLTLS